MLQSNGLREGKCWEMGDGRFIVSISPEKSLGPLGGRNSGCLASTHLSPHWALTSVNRREDAV